MMSRHVCIYVWTYTWTYKPVRASPCQRQSHMKTSRAMPNEALLPRIGYAAHHTHKVGYAAHHTHNIMYPPIHPPTHPPPLTPTYMMNVVSNLSEPARRVCRNTHKLSDTQINNHTHLEYRKQLDPGTLELRHCFLYYFAGARMCIPSHCTPPTHDVHLIDIV